VIVMPAIDVRGGRAVRLVRGRTEQETVYAEDPAEVARRFAREGATWLHVVDLDAALGRGANRDSVAATVRASDASCQIGGGLRSMAAVEGALGLGAARAVVGTEAVADPGFLRHAVRRFEGAMVVALDTDGDRVLVRGWTAPAGPLPDLLVRLSEAGAPRFLVTAVERDGTLQGPDLALYQRVLDLTDRPVLASGGVRAAGDVRALAGVGVEGVVVGTALYEGTLTLAEALEAAA
jgi:phosphoribosyl isomerase A